jgi:ribosomal protein S18 acetylase RimI-like enzyme
LPNERLVDLTIRAARTSDAAALATLMCELGYETSTAEMQKRLERVVRDSRYRTFVAEEQRTIRGMIGTFAYHTFEHDDLSGRILELVVSKRSRRSGIGRRLISAAEEDFAQRNIRRIAVNTRFERKQAHEFYEALGYRRNGFRFVKNLG